MSWRASLRDIEIPRQLEAVHRFEHNSEADVRGQRLTFGAEIRVIDSLKEKNGRLPP